MKFLNELCDERINHINDKFIDWLSEEHVLDDVVGNSLTEYEFVIEEDDLVYDLNEIIEEFEAVKKVRVLDFKDEVNYINLLSLLEDTLVNAKMATYEP